LNASIPGPRQRRIEAIQLLLALEQEYAEPYELTSEDRAAVDRSLEEMRQGKFATRSKSQRYSIDLDDDDSVYRHGTR
jgi:hypothetical protein